MFSAKMLLLMIMIAVSVPMSAMAAQAGTHPGDYPGAAWSPYLVGALIGVLSMLTFYFSNKPLGASTAYARLAGMVGKAAAPKHTSKLKYYKDNKPAVDWEVMLVIGAILGAFLAAWQGNELRFEWIPAMWAARFGEDSLMLRLGTALVGGMLVAFGSRLAGGCTSGHGISGTLQLAVGSWIAAVCFFLGGIGAAMLMYRV
jgi:uncharacterized protein